MPVHTSPGKYGAQNAIFQSNIYIERILPYSNVSVFGVLAENGACSIRYVFESMRFCLRVRAAPLLKRISVNARPKGIGCAPFSFKYGAV